MSAHTQRMYPSKGPFIEASSGQNQSQGDQVITKEERFSRHDSLQGLDLSCWLLLAVSCPCSKQSKICTCLLDKSFGSFIYPSLDEWESIALAASCLDSDDILQEVLEVFVLQILAEAAAGKVLKLCEDEYGRTTLSEVSHLLISQSEHVEGGRDGDGLVREVNVDRRSESVW